MNKTPLFASIRLRPIADHAMLTVGRSARDLLGTLAAWSKKKRVFEGKFFTDNLIA